MKEEVCANGGHRIGRLEQTHVYRDNVVCKLCYNRLKLTEETAVPFEEVRSPQHKLSDVEKPPIKGKWNGFCITAFVLSLVNLPGPEIEMSPDVRAIAYGLSFIVFVLSPDNAPIYSSHR